ncbi:hypothetical protein BJY59DRAFT_534943 [Rhodotorula toruloides]
MRLPVRQHALKAPRRLARSDLDHLHPPLLLESPATPPLQPFQLRVVFQRCSSSGYRPGGMTQRFHPRLTGRSHRRRLRSLETTPPTRRATTRRRQPPKKPGLYKQIRCVDLSTPTGVAYNKLGTIQRRLAWPLHKDDTCMSERLASKEAHFFGTPAPLTRLVRPLEPL